MSGRGQRISAYREIKRGEGKWRREREKGKGEGRRENPHGVVAEGCLSSGPKGCVAGNYQRRSLRSDVRSDLRSLDTN